MELADFEQLLTPRGQELLAAAMELQPNERTFLAAYEKIRKRCDPDLAKAAVETAILRAKAAAKFPNAAAMYFTREALEQSSSAAVAGYRARRFKQYGRVADLCCGIGGDALAFAAAGCRVVAVERDPLRARMAEANLGACGFAAQSQVVAADVLEVPMPLCDAAFCDPSRRADGRRFLSPADYQPAPNAVLDRFPAGFPVAFKLAPGVPLEDLAEYEAEAEFLSLDGELKECILWFGPDRKAFRRATVLPTGDTFSALSEEPLPDIVPPMRYVYDPDPALARSGLVGNWAESLFLKSLDERVAMLTSDSAFHTPFVTIYKVEETIPFHAKRLTEYLRARNIGRVTPVKRGSTVDTEALLRQLKLRGDEHRTILFTRMSGQQVAIVANRIDAPAAI